MGWQDRQYDSPGQGGPGGGGFGGGGGMRMLGGGFQRKSIVFWLIMINLGVFVIDGLISRFGGTIGVVIPHGEMRMGPLEWAGYFSADTAILHGQVWRFVTFQFLHGGIGHIFGNMLGLFFFGPMIEQYWGSRRFLAFYLLCGLAGPIAYMGFWGTGLVVGESWIPMVGASAGVFGILVAAAMIAPNTRVWVMMMFPVPLKVLIWVILGVAAYTVIAMGNQPGANAGGEAAHLGGAGVGFLLMKKTRLLNWADRLSPIAIQDGINKGRFERKVKKEQAGRAEVDRVLAKVAEHGLHSLSAKEKKTLQQDTDRLRGDD